MTDDKVEETTQNVEEEFKREQMDAWREEWERKQDEHYKTGSRRPPIGSSGLKVLAGLIEPVTTGFDWINLDMSFTNLTGWDVIFVQNSSFLITFCKMHQFKKSEYIERANLAAFLNVKKSQDAKTMEIFTTTVTKQTQEYADKTHKKTTFFGDLGKGKEKT